jgi:transposase
MQRDRRTLDHGTLETIRLMAVERVREGEAAPAVIASYGFNRTTIYKWLAAAAKPSVGLGALKSRPAPGRPRSLTSRQEQQVFRWINGNDPRQYGLDFGLWTRSVVAELVERKFAVRLGLTAIGELLARLNLTPQKPLQRAYQRDPEAIERWQRVSYPAVARQARMEGGEVFFWDESGFRAAFDRATRARPICMNRWNMSIGTGMMRWSGKFGQEAKLGSPWRKDGPDDGEAEALHGGVQSKDCS